MFHIMAGVAGLYVRTITQSCCTSSVRAQLWVKRPAVAWAKVQKWAWCHMWKAFESALGIQKFHKRGNPVRVQLADEAIQRYFEDIMWSNSFNIVIGQCFSLVHHKTCRDSQKQSTITPPSGLEILNLGILTIFQVSSETGEWRLGPAATVHPSTQTAEHQSHPGVERGPAPPNVRDQMDQIGAKTVSSLTNETTFFSSFFATFPGCLSRCSTRRFSIEQHTSSKPDQNPARRWKPQEQNNAWVREHLRVRQQKSAPALPNAIWFSSGLCFPLSASLPSESASLPRAPLWRRCVVDLRLLCCKCESFPKWALVCSIHGRWTDRCIFFFFFFLNITFYLHILYIWLLYSESRTVLFPFADPFCWMIIYNNNLPISFFPSSSSKFYIVKYQQ